MKFRLCHKILLSGFLCFVSLPASSQSSSLKNLEAAVTTARNRVEMNERKVSDADSIIKAGKMLIDESKAEMKAIDAGSRKLEKEYASRRKPLSKTAGSKDKAAANTARADLRKIDTQYKADNRALETRLREAERKQTTGISNIERGRTARRNAMDALKVSENALKAAEAKYNAAAGNSGTKPDQQKKKK